MLTGGRVLQAMGVAGICTVACTSRRDSSSTSAAGRLLPGSVGKNTRGTEQRYNLLGCAVGNTAVSASIHVLLAACGVRGNAVRVDHTQLE